MQTSDSHTILAVALSMMKGVTTSVVHQMEDCGISLEDFFRLSPEELTQALGISRAFSVDDYKREEALFAARREGEFMDKHNIRAYFLGDDDYPARLAEVADPPVVLYQLGNCNLDAEHTMSVVGTRRCTPYGADFSRKLVTDIAQYFPDVVVFSGLAYGIDAVAHQAALDAGVKTVGVLAHGLNTIYPAAHRDLAKRILQAGGALLSEYPMGTTPFQRHFLERNRIVAALSDALVVAESEIKGGAMSTANYGFHYSREVLALPGRINDKMSAGCNYLIRKNKASLITGASDLLVIAGWEPMGLRVDAQMRSLFPELEGDMKVVYDYLRNCPEPASMDMIHQNTRIGISQLRTLLTDMELDGVLIKHPGNRYAPAT